MKETEVTQAEWTAQGFPNPSGANSSGDRDCDEPSCPVGNVTFFEALHFANALSDSAGLERCYALSNCDGGVGAGMTCLASATTSLYACRGYRLPTEAEWEYAARAGTRSPFFSGEITPQASTLECFSEPALDGVAWYCANADASTHPVRTKVPNQWGLYDMLGNAAEKVSDEFTPLGYGAPSRTDPQATLSGNGVGVCRGGLAWGWASLLRSANRLEDLRHFRGPGIGFRLVRRAD